MEADKNPAMYKIILVDGKGKPVQIHRWKGTDKNGILSIGQTSNMERRRKQFLKAINDGGELFTGIRGGHVTGNMIHLLDRLNGKKKLKKNLRYESKTFNSKPEAENAEKEAIRKYVEIYFEVPPLNSNIPDRKGWAQSLIK